MGAENSSYLTSADGGLVFGNSPWVVGSTATVAARPSAAACNEKHECPATATGIKAVLFDIDDVFYDASAWDRWLAQRFARLSERTLEAEFNRAWREEFLPAVYRGQQEFHLALACCLAAIGLATSFVEELVAASRAQRRRDASSRRPFPGVRGTLSQLQTSGVARGVLANADRCARTLTSDLGRLGLAGMFDHVLSSVDLQLSLTEASCFGHALDVLQVPASQVLFVGHECRCLQVARDAGLSTVAFNARETVPGIKCIERFEDLTDLVSESAEAAPTLQTAT